MGDDTSDSVESTAPDPLARRLDAFFRGDKPTEEADQPSGGSPLLGPDGMPEHRTDQGRRIGRFELGQAIGFGAFGVVYAATDPELNRPVAIKLPRLEVLMDRERRGRFATEANITAGLEHPGIVPVYEARLEGDTPFIVSQLIDGPDLGAWLEEQSAPPPWRDAAELVAQMADAVAHAHANGVVHRDLKPSNVLLQPHTGAGGPLSSYRPRLTDFGLAKAATFSQADTRTSLVLGTPLYMAPEQLASPVDTGHARSPIAGDIYSLGVILFELLTGAPFRAGATYAELLEEPTREVRRSAFGAVRGAPEVLAQICRKCLEPNPNARYTAADQLAADLRACVAGELSRVPGVGWREQFLHWSRQKRRVTDAGWLGIFNNLVITIWVLASVFLVPMHLNLTDAELTDLYVQLAVLVLLMHLPMVWIGWKTVQRKRWAIIAGTLLAGFNCIPAVLPLIGDAIVAPPMYRDVSPLYQTMIHLFISLWAVVSFGSYAVAWIGVRSAERLFPPEAPVEPRVG